MNSKIHRGLTAPPRVIALIIATISVTLLISGCTTGITENDKSSSEITLSYDELMTILAKQCVILEQQLKSQSLDGNRIEVTPEMYEEIDITDFDYNKISFDNGQVYYYASDGYVYCITPENKEALYEE